MAHAEGCVGALSGAVWIVVLNWNNGRDTVDCLQSVLDVQDPAVAGVVVCDNGSTDDSVLLVRNWAGSQGVCLAEHRWHGARFDPAPVSSPQDQGAADTSRFVLVHTGANLGFAGGNNVGLRFVQQLDSDGPLLLLNNDALLSPGCVSAMARRLAADAQIGMCGATVIYHHTPSMVQAWGGASFQPWLARATHLGGGAPVTLPRQRETVEAQLDYILGAALMVSRRCLDAVGLMNEDYFLYYEEIDWAVRARRSGFRLGYAPDAEVWHKEGRTIGSSGNKARRSLLSEHYLVRSSLRFTRRFYPWCLPSVVAYSLLVTARALLRGDARRALTRGRAVLGLAWRA
jgi:GT2 family glycosyltransferase